MDYTNPRVGDNRSRMNNSLTNREREVMMLVTEGKTNKEISEQLFMPINTVRDHRKKAFRKLGAHNAVQAVMTFIGRRTPKEGD